MKNRLLLGLMCAAALTASACLSFERQSSLTGPSASGLGALLGNWTSANIIPSPTTCTDFKWNVTENTGTTASGTFSATCAGNLTFTGSAQGTLNGATISWTAAAIASGPGIASCNITLMGTAQIQTDRIIIPYAGDTCLGKVNGTETLRKK